MTGAPEGVFRQKRGVSSRAISREQPGKNEKEPPPAEDALFLFFFILIFIPAGGRNRLRGGDAGRDLK
jgi:hypothetical protein